MLEWLIDFDEAIQRRFAQTTTRRRETFGQMFHM